MQSSPISYYFLPLKSKYSPQYPALEGNLYSCQTDLMTTMGTREVWLLPVSFLWPDPSWTVMQRLQQSKMEFQNQKLTLLQSRLHVQLKAWKHLLPQCYQGLCDINLTKCNATSFQRKGMTSSAYLQCHKVLRISSITIMVCLELSDSVQTRSCPGSSPPTDSTALKRANN